MREFEPMRQFLKLSQTLNFSRAAAACYVTPSALSRSIRKLEEQLGERLFERDQHHVSLTPAGEAFRRYALGVVDGWDEFERTRGSERGALTGTLHVYCTVTAAQSIVPDLLEAFRERHPAVRLELVTGYAADALEQLRAGDVDVSVAALPDALPANIEAAVIAVTPVVFVAPLDWRRIDWSSAPMILPAHGLARIYVDEWLDLRGITPTVYGEIDGHEAILALVALGCGVGVVPRLVLEKTALHDRVREVAVRPPLRPFRIAACARRRSFANPLVRAFWDTLPAG
jgi:LysR family positive regulator for ilvC